MDDEEEIIRDQGLAKKWKYVTSNGITDIFMSQVRGRSAQPASGEGRRIDRQSPGSTLGPC